MDYKQWVDLFGRTTEDEELRDALTKAGVKKPPVIPKDETDARVELDGIMLVFTSEALFPDPGDVGEGAGVLSGVVLFLNKGYTGALPFDLHRDDSQETLRARFGEPVDEDAEFCWDEWHVEGLMLNITYVEDLQSLDSIMVALARPD